MEYPQTFAHDDLSKSHPAFLWAFRATRNWPILSTLIPGMRYHLVTNEAVKKYVQNGRQEDPNTEGSDVDFGLIFKELFCVAAQELASHLNQPLEELGVLYDDIVITGTYKSGSNLVNMVRGMSGRPNDIERGPVAPAVGKGQVLFAVRHLDKQEASFLAASGYRFAPIPQIAPTLAKEMQITHNEMLGTLQSMEDYSLPNKMMEPGVYLVCFSLTPSLPRGFDILVPKNRPNVLPYKSLPIAEIAQWQQDILHRMDGLSLTSCIRWLKANGGYSEPEKIDFCRQMHKTVSRLASYLTDPALGQAKFSSRPVKIPCRNPEGSRGPSKCTAYSFRIINNLQDRAPPPALCLRPLRLFNAQQQVYPQVPDHEHFRSAIIEEFSHCVAANQPDTRDPATTSSSSSLVDTPRPGAYFNPFHSYPKSELSKISSEGEKPLVQRTKSVFGGIVVSNQVTVDVVERPASTGEPVNLEAFEMNDLNTTMVVGAYNHADQDTFVDELCAMCRDNDMFDGGVTDNSHT